MQAILYVSCKLLQDVLVRIFLKSFKISGIFEPGKAYETTQAKIYYDQTSMDAFSWKSILNSVLVAEKGKKLIRARLNFAVESSEKLGKGVQMEENSCKIWEW